MTDQSPARRRSPRLVRDESKPEGAPGSLALEPPAERPRPLGASETARHLLAALAKRSGEHSAIEVARNARGDVQWKITVRSDPESQFSTPELAADEAERLHRRFEVLFPMAGGSRE